MTPMLHPSVNQAIWYFVILPIRFCKFVSLKIIIIIVKYTQLPTYSCHGVILSMLQLNEWQVLGFLSLGLHYCMFYYKKL